MNNDGLNWFFSSSAQTVAAFVAFLLSGFSISINMADEAVKNDDTYKEIISAFKSSQYIHLKDLSFLTGLAITTNLLILGLAWHTIPYYSYLHYIGFTLNFLAILLAIIFILKSVDPLKYQKTAKKEIENMISKMPPKEQVGLADFITIFIEIEKKMRSIFEIHSRDIIVSSARGMDFLSLNKIIYSLSDFQIINKPLTISLNEISKYRNLVVHGHIESVDPEMIAKAKLILLELNAKFPSPSPNV